MKHLLALSLATALVLGIYGCGSSTSDDDDATGDDDASESASPTPTATPAPLTIEHKWLSEGDDVSPLLKYYKVVKVEATFNSNQTYTVSSTDDQGVTTEFTGTYTVSASTVEGIKNITLSQSTPYTATAVGIYQIDETKTPARMTYEVAQTDPAISGVNPPTAEAGFGSTTGVLKNSNIQYYNLE